MYDNYPPGAANDPNAPYNQPGDPDPIDVEVAVSYSMSRNFTISVANYSMEVDEDCDIDDEGHSYCHMIETPDFSDTNLEEEFKDNEETLGIPQLLSELQTLVEEKLESVKNLPEVTAGDKYSKKKLIKKYQNILESSKDWIEDELDVELQ